MGIRFIVRHTVDRVGTGVIRNIQVVIRPIQ